MNSVDLNLFLAAAFEDDENTNPFKIFFPHFQHLFPRFTTDKLTSSYASKQKSTKGTYSKLSFSINDENDNGLRKYIVQ